MRIAECRQSRRCHLPRDELCRDGIAFVPYFPLGGFTPLHSSVLSQVATRNRSMRFAPRSMHDGARPGLLQHRAHAAMAAMRSRAFSKAASRASGPKANPSARTTVTSVNPMKVRMLVR